MQKSITFQVTGNQTIVCEGCEERIETMLKGVPGVAKVRARSSNQRVDVLLDPALSAPETIVEKLRQAGYHANVATVA